jgi:hypothetical protein
MRGNRIADAAEERSSPEFPAYNMYADKKWNYGITGDCPCVYAAGSGAACEISDKLPHLTVTATEITNYGEERKTKIRRVMGLYKPRIAYKYVKGDFTFTPRPIKAADAALGERAQITLYPYGASKLRITVFPIIGKREQNGSVKEKRNLIEDERNA